jgi:Fur family transcriptional regulator, zinc uptake regulator
MMARARTAHDKGEAAVFPAPGHDHDRCTSDAMAVAEARCSGRGQRLTPIRRDVLGALLTSHRPLGAYEIMERVAPSGPRPAPITVYRALEFLRENGLVHRIESRNAFVACVHSHAAGDLVVFLICERCGTVGEASSSEVASTVKSAAHAVGFTPKSPVIEISGICTHCGKG